MKKAITIGALLGLLIVAGLVWNDHHTAAQIEREQQQARMQALLEKAERDAPKWVNDLTIDPMTDEKKYWLEFKFLNKARIWAHCSDNDKTIRVDFISENYMGRDRRKATIQYRFDKKEPIRIESYSWGTYKVALNGKFSDELRHKQNSKWLNELASSKQVLVKVWGESSKSDVILADVNETWDKAFKAFTKFCPLAE